MKQHHRKQVLGAAVLLLMPLLLVIVFTTTTTTTAFFYVAAQPPADGQLPQQQLPDRPGRQQLPGGGTNGRGQGGQGRPGRQKPGQGQGRQGGGREKFWERPPQTKWEYQDVIPCLRYNGGLEAVRGNNDPDVDEQQESTTANNNGEEEDDRDAVVRCVRSQAGRGRPTGACYSAGSLIRDTIQSCLKEESAAAGEQTTTQRERLQECTASYVDCLKSNLPRYVEQLPACLKPAIRDLVKYHVVNKNTCQVTNYHNMGRLRSRMMRQQDTLTCDKIQRHFVSETICGDDAAGVSCCSTEWNTLLECTTSRVFPEDCTFDCTSSRNNGNNGIGGGEGGGKNNNNPGQQQGGGRGNVNDNSGGGGGDNDSTRDNDPPVDVVPPNVGNGEDLFTVNDTIRDDIWEGIGDRFNATNRTIPSWDANNNNTDRPSRGPNNPNNGGGRGPNGMTGSGPPDGTTGGGGGPGPNNGGSGVQPSGRDQDEGDMTAPGLPVPRPVDPWGDNDGTMPGRGNGGAGGDQGRPERNQNGDTTVPGRPRGGNDGSGRPGRNQDDNNGVGPRPGRNQNGEEGNNDAADVETSAVLGENGDGGGRLRRYLQEHQLPQSGPDDDESQQLVDELYEDCSVYAPGIFGNDDVEELLDRGGSFFQCIGGKLQEIVDPDAAATADGGTTSEEDGTAFDDTAASTPTGAAAVESMSSAGTIIRTVDVLPPAFTILLYILY